MGVEEGEGPMDKLVFYFPKNEVLGPRTTLSI